MAEELVTLPAGKTREYTLDKSPTLSNLPRDRARQYKLLPPRPSQHLHLSNCHRCTFLVRPS